MVNAKSRPKTRLDKVIISMAGSTSRVGNPLLADFLVVGRKLEKLGFIYHRGKVILIEPEEIR